MAPLVAMLANAGLTLLAEAVRKKGKKVVEKTLNVKLPDDPKSFTPEKVEELHRIEIEKEEDINSLLESVSESVVGFKVAEVLDRISAREEEVELATSKNVPLLLKYVKPLLAVLVIALSFLLIHIILFVDIPNEKRDIVNFIFGNVFGAVMAIITYYFGSSESSSYKNEVFSNLLKKANDRH